MKSSNEALALRCPVIIMITLAVTQTPDQASNTRPSANRLAPTLALFCGRCLGSVLGGLCALSWRMKRAWRMLTSLWVLALKPSTMNPTKMLSTRSEHTTTLTTSRPATHDDAPLRGLLSTSVTSITSPRSAVYLRNMTRIMEPSAACKVSKCASGLCQLRGSSTPPASSPPLRCAPAHSTLPAGYSMPSAGEHRRILPPSMPTPTTADAKTLTAAHAVTYRTGGRVSMSASMMTLIPTLRFISRRGRSARNMRASLARPPPPKRVSSSTQAKTRTAKSTAFHAERK
mmetsp:Transcript_6346/g.16254  ORF Transcript_6346/g.16254 Transcript_6346/m.16254 type:complete len:287 (+) Transcript_6346:1749-2609(+)